MNNLTFGDARFGYYETIGGGAGAGAGFAGASGVHTHMTNTRITDPEILESALPGAAGRVRAAPRLGRRRALPRAATASCASSSSWSRCASRSCPSGARSRRSACTGGGPAAKGRNTHDGRDVGGKSSFDVAAGGRVRIETPGGGGFGSGGLTWRTPASSSIRPTGRAAGARSCSSSAGSRAARPFLVEDDRYRPYFFTHPESTGLLADERDVEVEDTELLRPRGAPVVRVVAPVPPGGARAAREARGRRRARARGRHPLPVPLPDRPRPARGASRSRASRRAARRRAGRASATPSSCPAARGRSCACCRSTSRPPSTRAGSSRRRWSARARTRCTSWRRRPVPGAHAHARRSARCCARSPRASARSTPTCCWAGTWSTSTCAVLAARAAALGVPFEIGRVPGPIGFAQDGSFTRQRRAEIPGRMVLDGIGLVRDALIALDDYSLETVARAVLGRGKRSRTTRAGRAAEIERLYRDEPGGARRLQPRGRACSCSRSSRARGCSSWRSSAACSRGMQLDRVGASIASFDLIYLPELRRRGRGRADRERATARRAACRAARCSTRSRDCSATSRCSTSRACTRA